MSPPSRQPRRMRPKTDRHETECRTQDLNALDLRGTVAPVRGAQSEPKSVR